MRAGIAESIKDSLRPGPQIRTADYFPPDSLDTSRNETVKPSSW